MTPRQSNYLTSSGIVAANRNSKSSKKIKNDPNNRIICQNKRAKHEYEVIQTIECGIALRGGEVKSLREGRANLQDSYARIEGGEVWLLGAHISEYAYATGFGHVSADRKRKLLLHRRQIDELAGKVTQQSLTLIPLSLYFKDGIVKVDLALAKGKRIYDKRKTLAEREANREAERALRSYQKYRSHV
ncbi:MAG: SsrA-binding protein SmpB [Firmicutes bacterium]|jgi:SsrA-binding protein|nr:SsrA-binding protein SmpB [Bacillota bacterium]